MLRKTVDTQANVGCDAYLFEAINYLLCANIRVINLTGKNKFECEGKHVNLTQSVIIKHVIP
jgi:hypothetical protein